ncbi:hypothetical protein JCM16418A_43260 [Paenibacillus pini]|uniref:Copper amine oxidase domain protein n=1 Tax=Paenibacillus pini JCM 16418 TaxID=1236976 RepID=W7YMH1_9BACL|nr:copper amine oxidase domain protein [Paenibacillus pini JCM 16418]
MQKSWKKYISAMAGTALLAAMLGTAVGAAATTTGIATMDPYRIVAIGDSLTVGYEPGKSEKNIPYGFVDRLQEQGLLHGRSWTVNAGIAGLKSTGLLHYVEAVKAGQPITADAIQPNLPDPRTPQIGAATAQTKADLESADVITITIGGNDFMELIQGATKLSEDELNGRMEQLFKSYSDSMNTVINDLHELSPKALIVMADQYQPVPEIGDKVLYPKLMKAAASFTNLTDKLAAGYQTQGINVKVAHVAKEFVGSEGTMTHMIADRDIHPNQLGYEAMAKVFAESIWGSYSKQIVHEAGEPMGIIVSGKELNTPYKPVIRKNMNFVAIKDIVDAIGAKSTWDNKTSSATISYAGSTVVVKIGASSVKVNGEVIPVAAPAFLNKVGKESKTYVPLAVLASGLGFDVQYVPNLRTAFINP